VYAAGMSFPFPQRDVHIINDSTAASAVIAGDPDKKE